MLPSDEAMHGQILNRGSLELEKARSYFGWQRRREVLGETDSKFEWSTS
jgi:hypothetical protein